MFPKPPPILQTSLHAIANNPQDYFADVCFRYDSGEVWAHKGKKKNDNIIYIILNLLSVNYKL